MKHESISHLTRQQQRDRAFLDRARSNPAIALKNTQARLEQAKPRSARGKPTDRLTPAARRHIMLFNGCGGDLCRNCTGTGEEPASSDGSGVCHVCDGRGMR